MVARGKRKSLWYPRTRHHLTARLQSARYNVGVIDGISFPSLSYAAEPTPEDEVVDDTEESRLRELIFNVKDIPPPDFTIDDDAIFMANPHSHLQDNVVPLPRPENVGIIGLEVYFPKRVGCSVYLFLCNLS